MRAILFVLAFGAASTAAFALDCPAAPPLAAGTSAADAPVLKPKGAVMLALTSAPQVHFSVAARHSDDAAAWGGTATFTVETAGTWRVSLGSSAWIAVAQDGAEVRSSAHSHGERCSIKMVDFPLHAGKAVIEISAAPESSIRLMAAPAG